MGKVTDKICLEVCAGDLQSVENAAAGGADRVELCMCLDEGGVTPSAGLIREALKTGGVRVHVLIRPREGDFVYSPSEVEAMAEDIRVAARCGAHGVVIGALTAGGEIDMDTCRRLADAAGEMDVTFHRAFDRCADSSRALEQVISLGCTRLLTSGCAQSAVEGAATLAALNRQAGGRIIIMAGAGVNPSNAADIVRLTGVRELHASARTVADGACPDKNQVKMGVNDGRRRMVTSAVTVAGIRRAVEQND